MGLKVLSGIIIPREGYRNHGTAIIGFDPHNVGGDHIEETSSKDKETIGLDGPFSAEPSKLVSLRRMSFTDQDHSRPSEADNDTKSFDINDEFDATRRKSLTVSWAAEGKGAEVREISYLFFGPTLDLEPLDIHYVVLVDPARSALIPSPTSTHTHPITNEIITGTEYFQADIDLINSVFVDENRNPICIGDDCIQFRYHSHTFYHDFLNTSCQDLLDISNPPSPDWTESNADFRNVLAAAVNNCNDPDIVMPHAINFFIYDACDWPNAATGGSINWGRNLGHGRSNGDRPYVFVDYTRMLSPNRQDVRAAEEHELGHALGMNHTEEPNDDTMGHGQRRAFYRNVKEVRSGSWMNQHKELVNTARRHQRRWRGLD